jgi:hypothetical protein
MMRCTGGQLRVKTGKAQIEHIFSATPGNRTLVLGQRRADRPHFEVESSVSAQSPPRRHNSAFSDNHPRPPALPARHRIKLGAAGGNGAAIRELHRAAGGVDCCNKVAFGGQIDLCESSISRIAAREAPCTCRATPGPSGCANCRSFSSSSIMLLAATPKGPFRSARETRQGRNVKAPARQTHTQPSPT